MEGQREGGVARYVVAAAADVALGNGGLEDRSRRHWSDEGR